MKAGAVKLWDTRLDIPLYSARLVRRVIIDENLNAGTPVKWGGFWDIPINGKLISTGARCLGWTGAEWVAFINKNQ